MKSNKNEELKSRRDFFKKAAKSALPIIGAIVLSSPLSKAMATTDPAEGCQWGCSGSCWSSCQSTCRGACATGCTGTCTGGCKGACANSCNAGSGMRW